LMNGCRFSIDVRMLRLRSSRKRTEVVRYSSTLSHSNRKG